MIVTLDQETKASRTGEAVIRPAAAEDRAALLAMYLSFEPKGAAMGLPPLKQPENWLERLAEYPNFVAILGERVVAHAVLCTDGQTAEVAVFVHQDCRNQGLGKRLLGTVIEEARRRGLRRVWGVAEWDNVPMLRLARSLGFTWGDDPREFSLDLR